MHRNEIDHSPNKKIQKAIPDWSKTLPTGVPIKGVMSQREDDDVKSLVT